MLTSPITVTIAGTAHSLSRINNDNFSSIYLKKWTDNELRLTVRHSYEGKAPNQVERHNVDLIHTTFVADGNPIIRQVYTVIRNPRSAAVDEVSDATVGLNAWVTSNISALVAWES